MQDLEPLDPVYVADVLSKPPFITIPGVINVRDLGCYPSTTFPGKITRPRHLYRSAEIAGVSPEGKLRNEKETFNKDLNTSINRQNSVQAIKYHPSFRSSVRHRTPEIQCSPPPDKWSRNHPEPCLQNHRL